MISQNSLSLLMIQVPYKPERGKNDDISKAILVGFNARRDIKTNSFNAMPFVVCVRYSGPQNLDNSLR